MQGDITMMSPCTENRQPDVLLYTASYHFFFFIHRLSDDKEHIAVTLGLSLPEKKCLLNGYCSFEAFLPLFLEFGLVFYSLEEFWAGFPKTPPKVEKRDQNSSKL